MKVVDKEQERIDYENSPEGKRKKWLELLAAFVFCAVCLVLYRVLPHFEIGGGKPYVIVMDGLEVTPGKTTVQDLADAGYDLTDMSVRIMASDKDENGNTVFYYRDVYDLESEADARTLYDSLILVKEEKQAASISIINDGPSAIPLSQCIVSDITIHDDYIDAGKVTVEGVPFLQLTEEKLIELFGKEERNYDNTIVWEKGNYNFYLWTTESGTVRGITTNKYYKTDALQQYQN